MYGLDTTGRVITLCTFSKIFAPGFRVGWVIGHPEILDKLVMANRLPIYAPLRLSRK